jgi:hypothetical protein
MSSSSRQALVSLEFHLPNEEPIIFPIENKGPCNINYISPVAANSNESYEYSGRHDQGKLPDMKSTGPMAEVIAAMQEAKRVSDQFLSERINQVYGYGSKQVEENINEEPTESDEKPVRDENREESVAKKMRIEDPHAMEES